MCTQVNAIVGEVIPTRVQLTFSQLQNFIASIAIEREYAYYFWGHADVALMASNATATFSEEVFGYAPFLIGSLAAAAPIRCEIRGLHLNT